MLTENTQPAIVTMSIAALRVLEEQGVHADIAAGLSLGEYSAHIASGTFAFSDSVRLVKKKRVHAGGGAGGSRRWRQFSDFAGRCKRGLQKASEFGICEPANFNCPGQIVVSGEVDQ